MTPIVVNDPECVLTFDVSACDDRRIVCCAHGDLLRRLELVVPNLKEVVPRCGDAVQ